MSKALFHFRGAPVTRTMLLVALGIVAAIAAVMAVVLGNQLREIREQEARTFTYADCLRASRHIIDRNYDPPRCVIGSRAFRPEP